MMKNDNEVLKMAKKDNTKALNSIAVEIEKHKASIEKKKTTIEDLTREIKELEVKVKECEAKKEQLTREQLNIQIESTLFVENNFTVEEINNLLKLGQQLKSNGKMADINVEAVVSAVGKSSNVPNTPTSGGVN